MGNTETNDFGGLLPSWERSLRATNKSPRTVQSYMESAGQLADFLGDGCDLGDVDRGDVESWMIWLIEHRSASTARVRFASVQQLFRWAVDEGEIKASPMVSMKPPQLSDKIVPVIPDADLLRLLDSVTGGEWRPRRDAAVLWMLATTGVRVDELVGMDVDDVDLDAATALVTGKGDRERHVALATKTVMALDRYERARRKHRLAGTRAYWLGTKGRLTDSGVRQLVRRRGEDVGIDGLHPHQFRHTFAHRWLAKEGSESGLQTAAGWRSPQMLARYGASAKAERARAEAQRLGLDDF